MLRYDVPSRLNSADATPSPACGRGLGRGKASMEVVTQSRHCQINATAQMALPRPLAGEGWGEGPSVRLFPVVADADIDDQRHIERRDVGHSRCELLLDAIELGQRHFEHQLIVHLQYEA